MLIERVNDYLSNNNETIERESVSLEAIVDFLKNVTDQFNYYQINGDVSNFNDQNRNISKVRHFLFGFNNFPELKTRLRALDWP